MPKKFFLPAGARRVFPSDGQDSVDPVLVANPNLPCPDSTIDRPRCTPGMHSSLTTRLTTARQDMQWEIISIIIRHQIHHLNRIRLIPHPKIRRSNILQTPHLPPRSRTLQTPIRQRPHKRTGPPRTLALKPRILDARQEDINNKATYFITALAVLERELDARAPEVRLGFGEKCMHHCVPETCVVDRGGHGPALKERGVEGVDCAGDGWEMRTVLEYSQIVETYGTAAGYIFAVFLEPRLEVRGCAADEVFMYGEVAGEIGDLEADGFAAETIVCRMQTPKSLV
ncbi:hypothetical protein EJ07DRAFT_153490 [Lizonia empirigonia]|nr:hypothetical protein EJ07DRAFT_153490 [Lizonia empirigonia]